MKKILLLLAPVFLMLTAYCNPTITKEQITGVWQTEQKENPLGSGTYLDFQASGKVVAFVDDEWHRGTWWVKGDTLWFSRDFFDDNVTFLLVKELNADKMSLCGGKGSSWKCSNLTKTKLTSAEIDAKWKKNLEERERIAEESTSEAVSVTESFPIPEGVKECLYEQSPVFSLANEDSLVNYTLRQSRYPEGEPKRGTIGIWTGFNVMPDGSVAEPVVVLEDVSAAFKLEAVRVARSLPKFEQPPMIDGKPGKCFYIIPVAFQP